MNQECNAMNVDIEFKPYNSRDRGYVFDSYVRSMKSHIEKIWGWDQAWQEDNFIQSLDNYLTFVVVLNGEKAGYIQFANKIEFVYLSMLVLNEQYQSKGYGSKVLIKIQSLSPALPVKLRCFKVNQLAYKFYMENSFKVIGEDQEFYTLIRE